MKNVTRILAATVAAIALLTIAPAANARPITETVRLAPADHHVKERWVGYARFTKAPPGLPHVRFELNNGSVWISPAEHCEGPIPKLCKQAWSKARRAALVGFQ